MVGAALAVATPRVAHAEALLVVEADTGKVLQAENATYPWYPASVTKMMTAYVTLKAVKEGRLTLDGALTVSAERERTHEVEQVQLVHPPWFADEFDELGAAYFRSQGFDAVVTKAVTLPTDPAHVGAQRVVDWVEQHV